MPSSPARWARSSGWTRTCSLALGDVVRALGRPGLPGGPRRATGSRSRPGSRTWRSSWRWPTGPTGSTPRSRWPGVAPGPSSTPPWSSSSCADAEKVFHQLDELDSWDEVIDGEPGLTRTLWHRTSATRRSPAIGRFVDLKSPSSLGPLGRRSPTLAAAGGRRASGSPTSEQRLRAAAPGWWPASAGWASPTRSGTSPARSGAAEWERVRLYPHYTERMLHRSGALAPAGRLAGQVRERLDGSGYPSGLDGLRAGPPEPDPRHGGGVPDDAASHARTGRP